MEDIVRDAGACVAQDLGIAGPQAEHGERLDARVDAGEDRQAAGRAPLEAGERKVADIFLVRGEYVGEGAFSRHGPIVGQFAAAVVNDQVEVRVYLLGTPSKPQPRLGVGGVRVGILASGKPLLGEVPEPQIVGPARSAHFRGHPHRVNRVTEHIRAAFVRIDLARLVQDWVAQGQNQLESRAAFGRHVNEVARVRYGVRL